MIISASSVQAAWKNLCPDDLLCPNEARYYLAPGKVYGDKQIVTVPYYGNLEIKDPLNNNPLLVTRLLTHPDYTEVPEWDTRTCPGGTFIRHSGGNWISMLGINRTTHILNPAGEILHSFEHNHNNLFAFDIVTGPILEQEGRLYFGLHSETNFDKYEIFISDDAGLSWYTTKNSLQRRHLVLYPNPFGNGFLAVGRESSEPGNILKMTALFHLTISSDGTPDLTRIDDLQPVSSYGARMNAIAFDFKPDNLQHPTIYAASDKSILTSRDKGRSWVPLGGLRFTEPVNTLAIVHQQQSRLIVAGTVNSGIRVSKDDGKTWSPFALGLLDGKAGIKGFGNITLPAQIYYQQGQLLARTQGGWYRCSDFDCDGTASIAPPIAKRGTIPVIEFYNRTLDHYFMTSDNDEITAIETGQAGENWSRTGFSFTAWTPLGLNAGKSVCRFYGSQSPGPNSHFFSASTDECDLLHQLQQSIPAHQPRWNFESLPFMVAKGRAANAEKCAEGHIPIYRAYNNGYARGIDSNHRFVADHAEIDKLVGKGWTDEGIAFCTLP